MSDISVDDSVEDAKNAATDLLDNILAMENKNLLDSESADECIYHLNKLAALLGLDVDLDFYNDEYLNERENG